MATPAIAQPNTKNNTNKGNGHRIEIVLPSRPKRLYCAGPPPPRITLVPVRDSTAYIVSKLVLSTPVPVSRETGQYFTQRRLYYTIGWTDLPSARICVLATRVLDYVSPAAVEEWEYNDFLRREDEEKKLAEQQAATVPEQKEKRRPGRPRKGPGDSRRRAEAAAAALEEPEVRDSEADDAEPHTSGGPSLSTPSKRKLEELLRETEAEDTAEESESAAITRQLHADDYDEEYPSEEQYAEEMELDSEAVDLLEPPASRGTRELSSRASSLAPAALASRAAAAGASPAFSGGQKRMSVSSSSVAFPSAPPSLPDLKGKPPVAAARKRTPPVRREATPRSRISTRASTPLVSSFFPVSPANGAPAPPPPRRESTGFTPVIPPVHVPVRQSAMATAASQTPKPTAAPPTTTPLTVKPAPKSSGKPRSPKKRKRAIPEVPADDEVEWKVRALLADKYDYDADGNLVRYFKVLWDGEWPPSQNPSWEPEENISDDLKESYLRKKEASVNNGYIVGASPKKGPAAGRQGQQQTPLFMVKKRYSNVAEAFEAGIEEMDSAAAAGGGRGDAEEEDGEGDEERFVVTEDAPPKTEVGSDRQVPSSHFHGFDRALSSYRIAYGRGG